MTSMPSLFSYARRQKRREIKMPLFPLLFSRSRRQKPGMQDGLLRNRPLLPPPSFSKRRVG